MNKSLLTLVSIASSSLITTSIVNAQTTHNWSYSYGGTTTGDGGNWTSLDMNMGTNLTDNGPIGGGSSLNNYTWNSNTSFSLDVDIANPSSTPVGATFFVITNNAAAPETSDANWTALYLDGSGTFYATAYANDPSVSHTFTSFLSGNYVQTNSGGVTSINLNLNNSQLATLASGPSGAGASWEGFGYPFDNDGETTGNSTTPYRMGLWANSYLKDEAELSTSGGTVQWKVKEKAKVTKIDLVKDFNKGPTQVPEPSSVLLFGLGAFSLILRRKR